MKTIRHRGGRWKGERKKSATQTQEGKERKKESMCGLRVQGRDIGVCYLLFGFDVLVFFVVAVVRRKQRQTQQMKTKTNTADRNKEPQQKKTKTNTAEKHKDKQQKKTKTNRAEENKARLQTIAVVNRATLCFRNESLRQVCHCHQTETTNINILNTK